MVATAVPSRSALRILDSPVAPPGELAPDAEPREPYGSTARWLKQPASTAPVSTGAMQHMARIRCGRRLPRVAGGPQQEPPSPGYAGERTVESSRGRWASVRFLVELRHPFVRFDLLLAVRNRLQELCCRAVGSGNGSRSPRMMI